MPVMKALSIVNPWGPLILDGKKSIELRSWNTCHRGPFLVHAGRTVHRETIEAFGYSVEDLKFGYIIGVAELIGTKKYETWTEFNADTPKHLCYSIQYLTDQLRITEPPRLFGFEVKGSWLKEPVMCRGKLGFFNVEMEMV